MIMDVAIFGVTGFVGSELYRILKSHPLFNLSAVSARSDVGKKLSCVNSNAYLNNEELEINAFDTLVQKSNFDLAFLSLPHTEGFQLTVKLLDAGKLVVDLSADYRFKTPDTFKLAYGIDHPYPEVAKTAAIGIPEIFKEDISKASLVAVSGCYVTASVLALYPLLTGNGMSITNEPILVNALSGVSGAGKTPSELTHFNTINENLIPYGTAGHRHEPEMEEILNTKICFNPILAPLNRGILASCFVSEKALGEQDVHSKLREFYASKYFVKVLEEAPQVKNVKGTNFCHLFAFQRKRHAVIMAALDNLVKGAAGQAVQCANIMSGITETAGLENLGLYP